MKFWEMILTFDREPYHNSNLMKVAVFSTKSYERQLLLDAVGDDHELVFFRNRLAPDTARLAEGCGAVLSFVNDQLNRKCIEGLAQYGVGLIALRCAGYNQVDLSAAKEFGISVARVPAYSPFAVAEHTLALLLAVNRRIHKAYARVRENNFSLDGLMGFDIHGKTIGVIGTGKIGRVFCGLMSGFGCEILAYDPYPNEELMGKCVTYVGLEELMRRSHVISLHCPLTPESRHLINAESLKLCRDDMILVNTSRGALVDASALIGSLKSSSIGAVALDVYEEESGIFFEDLSNQVIQDDVLMRLMTFPNVLITSHQAFFTKEAVMNISETTAMNLTAYEAGDALVNAVL